jgi:hypothetical protein
VVYAIQAEGKDAKELAKLDSELLAPLDARQAAAERAAIAQLNGRRP